MARVSSKVKPLRKNIESVAPTSKPFGPLGPKVTKPRNPQILPENTERGAKARTSINVPGIKTQ